MDIHFRNSRLRRVFSSATLLTKKYGPERAKRIQQRLDDLRAARDLEEMRALPQARCHELKGDRKGTLSVDLPGQWRLLLKPADDVPPRKEDGGLEWNRVTVVTVLGVEDTHG